jgi:predicted enzyme related to lactoylglutathione lyase
MGTTVWAAFDQETDYFGPGRQPYMVNYRVDDLDAALRHLRSAGATVASSIDEDDYGRFAWAVDPEGNRFELWQPADGR